MSVYVETLRATSLCVFLNPSNPNAVGPLNVIDAVEVDFHEGADVVAVVFA